MVIVIKIAQARTGHVQAHQGVRVAACAISNTFVNPTGAAFENLY
jgi:hypothetical protein